MSSETADSVSKDRDEVVFHRSASSSQSRLTSGPPPEHIPQPRLYAATSTQISSGENTQVEHERRNPMPASGSRRDQNAGWSIGSEGHDDGMCGGPCKFIRSNRGCLRDSRCNMCHYPHPEVSSTSLRRRKARESQLTPDGEERPGLSGAGTQGARESRNDSHFAFQ
eukprot:TRINITY_DN50614_c0_g1_i1.p1 TRINITY_DN50614_c0_g1~~TRINITY_DN50614_c0_g1_i1.p1  ORF type:complete len:167 (+),score=5.91 TRINITY_DN50614_c0_g1_i1:128-628(+)